MSDINKKYVDYAGLSKYDELIKGQILSDAANAANTKVATLDTSSDVTIASASDGVVTLKAGIKEVDGIIAQGTGDDITLAKAATTGAAEDISYDNTTSGLTADDVQEALDELAAASSGGVASKTIWVHDNSAGQSAYAKVYTIYQGENDYVADRTDGKTNPTLKGTIDIPKDKVLQAASIVDVVFKASDNTLHEGSESGTDVTELIKGSTTPTADDAGKYLKMTMQNVDDPLYVNLQTFVDVYTVEANATEVQLSISNHVISAEIVSVDGADVTYKAESSAGAGDAESVKAALTRLDGSVSTNGSVKKEAKDAADAAVAALDTTSDVAIASHNSTTGVVTIAGSMAEADGIITAGSADNITFTPVSNAEIQALFSTVSA